MNINSILTGLLLAALVGGCAAQSEPAPPAPPDSPIPRSQDARSHDPRRAPRRRADVLGKITAIGGQTVTIKNSDGHDVTVTLTDNTRFTKDRQPAKIADFKVGDMAMVRGRSTGTDAWEADVLASRTAGPGDFPDAMGKKFIAGEIKAIDGTHLTIARMDGQSQTIAVDENTSFRRANDSITLADFKVGDHVFGPGEVKDGTFVASKLSLGDPREMRGGARGAPGPGDEHHPN
jgi:hypothetical protein